MSYREDVERRYGEALRAGLRPLPSYGPDHAVCVVCGAVLDCSEAQAEHVAKHRES